MEKKKKNYLSVRAKLLLLIATTPPEQLGINNLTNQASPTQVTGPNWTKAMNHSMWSIGITTN